MKRETFTDPETGREIESTWLAKGVSQNFTGFIVVPIFLVGTFSSLLVCLFLAPVSSAFLVASVVASIVGAILSLAVIVCIAEDHANAWDRKAHDAIALWQDRRREKRRQKRLLWRVTRHIPNGALSRAQPPGEPTPIAVSLSRAELPEDLPRLDAAVEDTTQDHRVGGLEVYETVSVSA